VVRVLVGLIDHAAKTLPLWQFRLVLYRDNPLGMLSIIWIPADLPILPELAAPFITNLRSF
jgi:hypothetical protein